MFKKILVANRGEIARRIILACREFGVRSVAVFSEADRDTPWVRMADESYPLVGVSTSQTYLNQEAILRIAAIAGVDALHPGYGFLSENAEFAAACAGAGITFIGPSPEAMRLMGSKAEARVLAEAAGVPVVPGVDGAGKRDDELREAALAIGFPILIKASAGGGGKGMRVVHSEEELDDALTAARSEARSAFGDDHVIVERYFTQIHHVEIQLLGDHHGNMIHLFERECSIQRRHQKIVEESPAPSLGIIPGGAALRQQMAAAAISLAQAAQYVNAGTVEFIVDISNPNHGRFYFLEMNTRLQVEHPVTELVAGLDLVAWQIRIAAGEPLPFAQDEIRQRGHAIECRIYAEDPANQFFPSTGRITHYRPPQGPGVRVDDGIETEMVITPHYDPMLAKLITWGNDRPDAIRKMIRALRDTVILGVTTNIPYLLTILRQPAFVAGETSTNYLLEQMDGWSNRREVSESDLLAVAVLELLNEEQRHGSGESSQSAAQPDPWDDPSNWRNVG